MEIKIVLDLSEDAKKLLAIASKAGSSKKPGTETGGKKAAEETGGDDDLGLGGEGGDDDFGLGGDEDAPKGPTIEDVRATLSAYAKATDTKTAKALIKEVAKVSSLSECKEADYQKIIDAAKKATAKAKK